MSIAPPRACARARRASQLVRQTVWFDLLQAVLFMAVAGLTVALVALLFAGAAFARAVDEEGPGLRLRGEGIEGVLTAPEVASDIDIQVTGVVARVRLRQLFHNPTGSWLEGLSLYPCRSGPPSTACVR